MLCACCCCFVVVGFLYWLLILWVLCAYALFESRFCWWWLLLQHYGERYGGECDGLRVVDGDVDQRAAVAL